MPLNDQKVKEILLAGHYVEEGKLKEAEKAAQSYRTPLADVLVESGQVTQDILGQAAAEYYKIPYADLILNEN